MSDVTILGPIGYRQFSLERECEENQGHAHNYDHVTFVQAGSVKVFYRHPGDTVDRESRVFRVGQFFVVKAEVHHRVKAMEPNTRYACVFTHRDFDGVVVQEFDANASMEAYDLKPEAAGV
jgi:quercetin dioxygenase-like cupin family protein